MKLNIWQVDAFASRLFEGNPAAVCVLEQWLPDGLMQSIAMENNLSETAFLVRESEGWRIRWFTPTDEVDLCGHATLASAHVLKAHLGEEADPLELNSNSGPLRVFRDGDLLELDFPAAELEKEAPPRELFNALEIMAVEVYKGADFLWVLESEEEVRGVDPDFREMEKVDTRGVIVTAPGEDVDFVSRFFAPSVGVDEDPVTGSAHTMLTPYWADRLDKNELTARQVSRRGGELRCRLEGDRVRIAGRALTYLEGEITLPETG
ncbi:MAG: PhzF family phenazine biosynthesis protein [Balneolaceae bacterium]|nr:PhzF family phenazine biosynthesis protein [Balneolaceae bacterium]